MNLTPQREAKIMGRTCWDTYKNWLVDKDNDDLLIEKLIISCALSKLIFFKRKI